MKDLVRRPGGLFSGERDRQHSKMAYSLLNLQVRRAQIPDLLIERVEAATGTKVLV